jgi:hypothetical protein
MLRTLKFPLRTALQRNFSSTKRALTDFKPNSLHTFTEEEKMFKEAGN